MEIALWKGARGSSLCGASAGVRPSAGDVRPVLNPPSVRASVPSRTMTGTAPGELPRARAPFEGAIARWVRWSRGGAFSVAASAAVGTFGGI